MNQSKAARKLTRFVFGCGLPLAGILCIITVIHVLMINSPHYPFGFGAGLLLSGSAFVIARQFGLEQSQSVLLWTVTPILANTVLGFLIGGAIGFVWCVSGKRPE